MDVPVINSIFQSNEIQKHNAVQMIMSKGHRNIGILRTEVSKAGTDDLRALLSWMWWKTYWGRVQYPFTIVM